MCIGELIFFKFLVLFLMMRIKQIKPRRKKRRYVDFYQKRFCLRYLKLPNFVFWFISENKCTWTGRSLLACWSSRYGEEPSRSTVFPESSIFSSAWPAVSRPAARSTPSDSIRSRLFCSFYTWRWWRRPIFPDTACSCSDRNRWLSPGNEKIMTTGDNYHQVCVQGAPK